MSNIRICIDCGAEFEAEEGRRPQLCPICRAAHKTAYRERQKPLAHHYYQQRRDRMTQEELDAERHRCNERHRAKLAAMPPEELESYRQQQRVKCLQIYYDRRAGMTEEELEASRTKAREYYHSHVRPQKIAAGEITQPVKYCVECGRQLPDGCTARRRYCQDCAERRQAAASREWHRRKREQERAEREKNNDYAEQPPPDDRRGCFCVLYNSARTICAVLFYFVRT